MTEPSGCAEGDQVSVVLQYWIEQELRDRVPSDGASVEQAIWEILHGSGVEAALAERLPGCAEDVARLFSDHQGLASVVAAAAERWWGGREAPVLRISARPFSMREAGGLLGDGVNLGLLFGAEKIYFQDTVHALQTDEIRSRNEGDRKVNVLGVHLNWRTEGGHAAKRCVLVDATGAPKEVRFERPVPLHFVGILHLPRDREIGLHRSVSSQYDQLGLPQLNPYAASARADDKARTHRLWSDARPAIPSPVTTYVPRGAVISDALGAMGSCRFVYVQPNAGTEGDQAERYCTEDPDAIARFISEEIWPRDDALVREERGTLRYCEGSSSAGRARGYLRLTVRVNVAWSGTRFMAESGFVQLADHADHPVASRGRNGSVMPLQEVLKDLHEVAAGKWHRCVVTRDDVACIGNTAVRAATALNAGLKEADYLKLVGVDLLLETDPLGRLVPVALEANPRPAGLAQSWMLGPRFDPGVTHALFEGIRRSKRHYSPGVLQQAEPSTPVLSCRSTNCSPTSSG